ncbi:MAG: hypothetical protein JW720_04500 [Sedimentisphaerales bacterium]|nr:hypothetical protein [Sedimentisphaerales bacterium]
MKCLRLLNRLRVLFVCCIFVFQGVSCVWGDSLVVKTVLDVGDADENLLKDEKWGPWQAGFERVGDVFVCDNGADSDVQRGVSQTVTLNQTSPEPIVAVAQSKAEDVGGGPNSDYSLYLDLIYTDGSHLWGQIDAFSVGSHDWEDAKVIVFPAKPVKTVAFHMLLRYHTGKAFFRNPELRVIRPPHGATVFDGAAVTPRVTPREGFAVRDVADDSDFYLIEHRTLGLELTCRRHSRSEARFFDVELIQTERRDRAITLYYTVPFSGKDCFWLESPRRTTAVAETGEYVNASNFVVGANGRLSRYPFAAVTAGQRGLAIGIDMARPAFFRAGYNAGTKELFLAYDIALTAEKPSAKLSFCTFEFDTNWAFRSALARYYELFPEHFQRRIDKQGLWMPFAKISEVAGWEDFGFAFKEGTNETKWDDEHGITTFRYTEPMTWWMPMPNGMPRTLAAALAEAQRLADEKGDVMAKAFLHSGYHNQAGQFTARLLDTPWCNGAVWSINSMPAIAGEFTDFKNKWNPSLREKLYGPNRTADLDGEYIDSSEGYVTDELDFRLDHFAAADAPLTFSLDGRKPAIFRGLGVFEYVRAIERDVHGMGKLMMANSTPVRLCWLAPLLDVMGTETNWNPDAKWQPMSDDELLYRRAMCKGKPYCFLMNTRFEDFSHDLVEKYMKRALAYGMFPGFFSHNASQGHYFSRPELYDRDRKLFKKYVPLCKLIAEAGWEPVTKAKSSDERVYIERFGERYFTVFNDSMQTREATISIEGKLLAKGRDLVRGSEINWSNGQTTVVLDSEDIAVIAID